MGNQVKAYGEGEVLEINGQYLTSAELESA
jgi:hypothetical protein